MANPFKRLREHLAWTQQECADYVGIHRVRWAKLEAGETPSVKTAQAVIELAEQNGKRLKLEDIFPRNHD